ncbi:MAG: hypothetical protein EBX40_03740 [Gammaproteobacteria bacterium]|nr:hypothetical protein [Gammaproteobacteria bacterium]
MSASTSFTVSVQKGNALGTPDQSLHHTLLVPVRQTGTLVSNEQGTNAIPSIETAVLESEGVKFFANSTAISSLTGPLAVPFLFEGNSCHADSAVLFVLPPHSDRQKGKQSFRLEHFRTPETGTIEIHKANKQSITLQQRKDELERMGIQTILLSKSTYEKLTKPARNNSPIETKDLKKVITKNAKEINAAFEAALKADRERRAGMKSIIYHMARFIMDSANAGIQKITIHEEAFQVLRSHFTSSTEPSSSTASTADSDLAFADNPAQFDLKKALALALYMVQKIKQPAPFYSDSEGNNLVINIACDVSTSTTTQELHDFGQKTAHEIQALISNEQALIAWVGDNFPRDSLTPLQFFQQIEVTLRERNKRDPRDTYTNNPLLALVFGIKAGDYTSLLRVKPNDVQPLRYAVRLIRDALEELGQSTNKEIQTLLSRLDARKPESLQTLQEALMSLGEKLESLFTAGTIERTKFIQNVVTAVLAKLGSNDQTLFQPIQDLVKEPVPSSYLAQEPAHTSEFDQKIAADSRHGDSVEEDQTTQDTTHGETQPLEAAPTLKLKVGSLQANQAIYSVLENRHKSSAPDKLSDDGHNETGATAASTLSNGSKERAPLSNQDKLSVLLRFARNSTSEAKKMVLLILVAALAEPICIPRRALLGSVDFDAAGAIAASNFQVHHGAAGASTLDEQRLRTGFDATRLPLDSSLMGSSRGHDSIADAAAWGAWGEGATYAQLERSINLYGTPDAHHRPGTSETSDVINSKEGWSPDQPAVYDRVRGQSVANELGPLVDEEEAPSSRRTPSPPRNATVFPGNPDTAHSQTGTDATAETGDDQAQGTDGVYNSFF